MLLLSMFINHIPPSMFSTSYFKSSLSAISIKSVNAIPLWDFLPSNFEVVLTKMTIVELFIVMTTSPG